MNVPLVIVVCKKYYIETLMKELGINATNISPNSTHIPSTDSFDEIPKSHCKFIESVGLEMYEEDKNLPYCTRLQNYIRSLSNTALLLAPANVPQKRFVMSAHQSVNHRKRWAN